MPHFALSHFPIALLSSGAMLLVLSWFFKNRAQSLRPVAIGMLCLGALFSVPTMLMGLWIAGAHGGHHGDALETHRILGISTSAVALLGLALHLVHKKIANADLVRDAMFLVAAGLVLTTGYFGAEMSHGDKNAEMSGAHSHVSTDEGTAASGDQEHVQKHPHPGAPEQAAHSHAQADPDHAGAGQPEPDDDHAQSAHTH